MGSRKSFLGEITTTGVGGAGGRNASGQSLSASILQPQSLSAIEPQAISAIEARMT